MIAAALLAGAAERRAVALPPPGRAIRTPWDFYRELLANKMPDLDRCSALARKRGTFGDLTAHFDWRVKGYLTIDSTKSLSDEVRRCALDELQPYAAKVHKLLAKGTDFDMSWQLGAARPLFPMSDEFLRAWSEAATGSAANDAMVRRFTRMLPADAKLVDGCVVLQPPAKFAFSEAIDLWKKKRNAKAIDGFWNGKLSAVTDAPDAHFSIVSFPAPHLLVQVERHDGDRETDPRTALYPPRRPAPSIQRLCLRPFDDHLSAQLTKAMDAAGRCWRNGSAESLTAPRFSFPGGHAYARVGSTTRGPACALDVAGEITCCGPTTTTLPGRYQDLDVAADLVCTVSAAGEASCVDIKDGRRVLTLAGKFTRVSASTAGACGINEGAAVVCEWTVSRPERPPQGKFREVDAGALCAIDLAGELVCWSGGRTDRVGKGPWREVRSSKTDGSSACALDRAGRAWCWSTTRPVATLAPAPASSEFSRIGMGLGGACGIHPRCGLECWAGHGPPRAAGLCARDISVGNPSCVALQSGQAGCWGDEMWAGDPVSKGGD